MDKTREDSRRLALQLARLHDDKIIDAASNFSSQNKKETMRS
jgi:hypothetical protein